jgi:hypothetical protein
MLKSEILLYAISNSMLVRTDFVLFPLDTQDFLSALSKAGYGITPRRDIPQPPIGAKIDISGVLARKGQVVVNVDTNSQTIAAQGPSPWEVAAIFDELDRILNTELSINTRENSKFFECSSSYNIIPTNSPMRSMSKIDRPELNSKFASILDQDITNYSLHICSPAKTVNQPNWFDMEIRPVGNKSDTTYELFSVFRKTEKTVVSNFLHSIEEKIRNIIRTIDQ